MMTAQARHRGRGSRRDRRRDAPKPSATRSVGGEGWASGLARDPRMRYAACAVLMAAAALLRFNDLAGNSVWYDEAVAALNSRGGPAEVIPNTRAFNSSPALYPLILWAVQAVESSPFSIRLIPAIASTLTVAALLFLAPRVGIDRRAAFIAALLATLAPEAVVHAQDAREYSVDALVAVLIIIGVLSFFRFRGLVKRSALLCAALLAAPLAQYGLVLFGAAALAAMAIEEIRLLRTGRASSDPEPPPMSVRGEIAAFALPVACFAVGCALSYATTLRYQWTGGESALGSYLAPYHYAGSYSDVIGVAQFALGRVWILLQYHMPAIVAGAAVAAFAASLIPALQKTRFPIVNTLLLTTLCVALTAALLRVYPIDYIRQSLFLGPIVHLAAGQNLQSLLDNLRPNARWIAFLLAITAILATGIVAFRDNMPYREFEDINAMFRVLDERMQEGDVVYVQDPAVPAAQFYQERKPDNYYYGACNTAVSIEGCVQDMLRAAGDDAGRLWILSTHKRTYNWRGLQDLDPRIRVEVAREDWFSDLYLVENIGVLPRSYFEVSATETALVYRKSPCDPADLEPRFYLRVFPVNGDALPEERKRRGFDNFDFNFASFGALENGECVAERPLPDYPIRRVETGQFSAEGVLWAVRIAVAE